MLKISGRLYRSATLRFALAATLALIGTLFGVLSLAANPTKRVSAIPTPAGWSVVDSPNDSSWFTAYLSSTICISSSDCWAVGTSSSDQYDETLAEHWDGAGWSIVPSPNIAGSWNEINEVACASSSECWAVGYYFSRTNPQTLIERWDGSKWSIVTSPNPANYASLLAATCVSASDCWAVGSTRNSSNKYQTLTEHWDGVGWSTVSSPSTSATLNNVLQNVICTSSSQCWAVGYASNGTADQTLIEEWNGTSWLLVNSPDTSATRKNHFVGVTCISPSQCWAVGYANNGTADQTLIAAWNGTSWSIVSSPNTDTTQNNYAYSVTCPTTSDCWTGGLYTNGSGIQQTLILQWTGSSWSIANSPDRNTAQDNRLSAITCALPSQCWAVGYIYDGDVTYQTLVEEYLAMPLQLTAVNYPSDGHFLISGQSPPQIAIDIQVSPDLVSPFTTLTTITSDTDGIFQYDDTNATSSKNFYRAAYH